MNPNISSGSGISEFHNISMGTKALVVLQNSLDGRAIVYEVLDAEVHQKSATEKWLEVFLCEANDFAEEFSRMFLAL